MVKHKQKKGFAIFLVILFMSFHLHNSNILVQENRRKLLCESKTKLDVKNKQALSTTHKQCSMVMLPYKKFETDFFCLSTRTNFNCNKITNVVFSPEGISILQHKMLL